MAIIKANKLNKGKGQATRYLGVHFELNLTWATQRNLLAEKFKGLQDRITSTKPTREQAVYCVNAVINAAMKYPLQVAHIPETTLRDWDRANRAVIKSAGCISKQVGEAMHLPKNQGGLGLQSLEEAVTRQRVSDQIMWLNSDSSTGEVVRAAHKRNNKKGSNEKNTLQAHTKQALGKINMEITPEKDQWTDLWGNESENINYMGAEEQARQDQSRAHLAPRLNATIHAFGDGATWTAQDKAGWGTYLMRRDEQGNEVDIQNHKGRLSGTQQNDAAETMAIIIALTKTNVRDNLVIYCDNQGCVDTWNRLVIGSTPVIKPKQTNRALWNRIKAAHTEREIMGAQTTLLWIHSHVDDEGRRNQATAKYTCACRKEGSEACTSPGMENHWMHEPR